VISHTQHLTDVREAFRAGADRFVFVAPGEELDDRIEAAATSYATEVSYQAQQRCERGADQEDADEQLARLLVAQFPAYAEPVANLCGEFAIAMVALVPSGPEVGLGLEKLIEARNAFVAAVAGEHKPRQHRARRTRGAAAKDGR